MLNFPPSPSINDVYTSGGRSWVFNGIGWAPTGAQGPVGDKGAVGDKGPTGDQGPAGSAGSVGWADVTGKPTTFPPAAHTHAITDVTGLQTALNGKQAASANLDAWSGKSAPSGAVADLSTAQTLAAKTLQGVTEVRVAMGAGAAIDLRAGNVFTKTISGATTLSVTNVPAAGTVAMIVLELTNGASAAINWWSGIVGPALTLSASGRDVLVLYTHDGGSTWTRVQVLKGL